MDWLVSKNIKYYRLACSAGIFCVHKCIHVFSYQATILYLLTVEDWGEEILAEGVGVKWKKGQPLPHLYTNPLLFKHPVIIQDGGIDLIYLVFRSKMMTAQQANYQLID